MTQHAQLGNIYISNYIYINNPRINKNQQEISKNPPKRSTQLQIFRTHDLIGISRASRGLSRSLGDDKPQLVMNFDQTIWVNYHQSGWILISIQRLAGEFWEKKHEFHSLWIVGPHMGMISLNINHDYRARSRRKVVMKFTAEPSIWEKCRAPSFDHIFQPKEFHQFNSK